MAEQPTSGQPNRPTQRNADDTVLGKAFLLLDAFDPADDFLSLAEMTARTRLPKSTVHRIAESLVELGALQRHVKGFQLGTRLFEFGERVRRRRELRELALPYMQDLYEATHETVHLGVLDNLSVLYIEKISGHRRTSVSTRVGGRMPLHLTALGKAMLAFSEPDLLRAVVENGLEPATPHSIVVPKLLVTEMRTIAEHGVAFDREESSTGVSCVAAPVRGFGGWAIAAISLTGPTSRVNHKSLAPAVRTAALSLSRVIVQSHVENPLE